MDKLKTAVVAFTGLLALLMIIACFLYANNASGVFLPPPTLSSSTTAAEVSNYKEVAGALQTQRSGILDNVITKVLMPIFNSLIVSVLTFVFANKALKVFETYLSQRRA